MGSYKRNRNIILYSFICFCAFVIAFIIIMPDTPVNPFLIALCFIFGYMTYFQIKSMKRSCENSNMKLSLRQKRRRELLERQRGKVIEFPVRDAEDRHEYKSKKR